jgi:hypothetical protein
MWTEVADRSASRGPCVLGENREPFTLSGLGTGQDSFLHGLPKCTCCPEFLLGPQAGEGDSAHL